VISSDRRIFQNPFDIRGHIQPEGEPVAETDSCFGKRNACNNSGEDSVGINCCIGGSAITPPVVSMCVIDPFFQVWVTEPFTHKHNGSIGTIFSFQFAITRICIHTAVEPENGRHRIAEDLFTKQRVFNNVIEKSSAEVHSIVGKGQVAIQGVDDLGDQLVRG
jgi:hypothetical protein